MERYSLEDHEVYRKEQDEKSARETEGRSERMEKESARRAWIADGGAGADFFEREWPKLREEGRRRRVVDADRRALEAQRNSRVGKI
jgi:hypothetical protein